VYPTMSVNIIAASLLSPLSMISPNGVAGDSDKFVVDSDRPPVRPDRAGTIDEEFDDWLSV